MKNYKNNKNLSGFSLTEALLGVLIIGVAGLSVFMLISTSNKTNLTGYYKFTAESIVKEAIEVFKCLEYDELKDRKNTNIAGYALDTWQELTSESKNGIKRPEIATAFVRKITLEPLDKGIINAILVTVEVKPKDLLMRGLGAITAKTIVIKKEI